MSGRPQLSVLALFVLLALFPLGAYAAGPSIIKGTLQIQWGEPERASGIEIYELTALDGTTYQLNLNDTQKAQLGRESGVQVTIEADVVQDYQATVQSVVEVSPKISVQSGDLQSRPRRYLNILCASPGTKKFPYKPANYQTLMQKESDFWFRTAGVTFETDTTDWVFASQPISMYLTFDPVSGWWVPKFHELANTCAQAAQNQIADPSVYDGINFMFAENIGCCAWGGGENVIFNGVSRFYKATWMPPWIDIMQVLAHELGHSLGLPHSAGAGGKAYGSRFDLMSDLWTDCPRAQDPTWACLPQGTIYPQLMRLSALDPGRTLTIGTNNQDFRTLYLASLYTPSDQLPPEYIYGVTINQIQYGDKFGITAEYRDNRKGRDYPYDVKLPVRGVVFHERNLFGRPDPEHLLVPGANDLVWAPGSKLTYSFVTICVVKETQYGVQIDIGLNGVDCANPPVLTGRATSLVLHDLAIVITEGINPEHLPSEIRVGVYRQEDSTEKLIEISVLALSPNQGNQYSGPWDKCDRKGQYFVKGMIGQVSITKTITQLACSKAYLPFSLK